MKSMTFSKGGMHPHDHKLTADRPIENMILPATVWIPLIQHIGSPAQVLVKEGDLVKVGTLIAKGQGMISAPVHSSVSGTVIKVDTVLDAGGFRKPAVLIKRDGDNWEEGIVRNFDLVKSIDYSPDQITDKINDGGLVGKGGATFPTRVKYLVPPGRSVDTLLINGVECEPYLTSDHRLMLERPEEVVLGSNLLRFTLGVKLAIIGVEENKADAIKILRQTIDAMGLSPPKGFLQAHMKAKAGPSDNPSRAGYIAVIALKVKYPQGAEKQLIEAILGREVPSGKLPLDVGVIVNNVATAHSAYKIVQKHKPMVERIVTVTGDGIARPGNYKIRIGMLVREVLQELGFVPSSNTKVILGGPMMGKTLTSLDVPVTKGCSGILVLQGEQHSRQAVGACIRCASCVSVCPMGLEPYLLEKLVGLGRLEEAEKHAIRDCVECGSCSYVCPAKRGILDYIRLGKAQLMRVKRS